MTNKNKKISIDKIIAFTDGSCCKKKFSTACGYGVYFPNKELANISRPLTLFPLTNQRAELCAIYKCIKKFIKNIYRILLKFILIRNIVSAR